MVPGRVVQAHARYLRSLTDRGVELALHGFDHVDFATLSPAAIRRQFERSADAFRSAHIPFHGFRCPYLSATDEVFRQLPADLVRYSSNSAVTWPASMPPGAGNSVTRQLDAFYGAQDARTAISLPSHIGGLVEFPCSLPDDIQIYDGLKAGQDGLARAWCQTLESAHAHGELQVLMFHPELADRCSPAFRRLLELADSLRPAVWIARLDAVAEWWRERSCCVVERTALSETQTLFTLRGSTRARLTRGSQSGTRLVADEEPWPLIGISPLVAASTRDSLMNLGYLLDDDQPGRCAFHLQRDQAVDRTLLQQLDAQPLIRIAPWPDDARAALCISGDLDALSLIDYARRLSPR